MEKRLINYLRYIEARVRELKELAASGAGDKQEANGVKTANGEKSAQAESEADKSVRDEAGRVMRDLLIQIGFFAHERLVHLIVTVTFAILTIVAVVGFLISEQTGLIALIVLLLVLLVPYIRHYYILENGVQKLYTFYDELQKISDR